MSFILAQAGNKLYKVNVSTGVGTEITLPTDVTLSTTRLPRFAVLGQWVVMVNSPSRNLVIDPEGTCRVLVPRPPVSTPVVSGSGTGLTGDYSVRCSFTITGPDDEVLIESPLSPISNTFSASNQGLLLTGVPISTDDVDGVRFYRNAAGGTVYFRWIDKTGNVGGNITDNMPDASLSILPSDEGTLLTPPGTIEGTRMRDVVSWQNRLWGLDSDINRRDVVTYTEAGSTYKWANTLTASPAGQDEFGVLGFLPRKNELGLVKRDGIWQVTGTSSSNYRVVQIAGGDIRTPGVGGCVATASCIVVNNTAYWLGKDGIYEWGDNGINNISRDQVDPWFTTDTYFNRARFPNAWATYNVIQDTIYFHLANLGSSVEDRWIGFDRKARAWFGPHKTDLITPTCSILAEDANDNSTLYLGSSVGHIYTMNRATRTDGTATAIDFDVIGKFHDANAPDIDHFWGELAMLSRVESGGTLTITPYVGRLSASAGTAISHDLTTGRQRLRRIGTGAMARLQFGQATAGQDVTLFGYEIPFFELGRR